eukprot:s2538_g18.t1
MSKTNALLRCCSITSLTEFRVTSEPKMEVQEFTASSGCMQHPTQKRVPAGTLKFAPMLLTSAWAFTGIGLLAVLCYTRSVYQSLALLRH